ncbi:MAG: S41 family peptidase [Woeseiaceae bacterium]|nr:S41 family peptidase [Woeseiaceae bacterium]
MLGTTRILLVSLALTVTSLAYADTRLLRFPDIHGDLVVFTHGGDLWLASADGGDARRLTSHPGLELFAKFSPDGTQIAFMGQYGGDEQVYVIPVTGGEPRQLTFYPAQGPLPARWGYDHQVYGWTPDGESVLFRSLRDAYGLTDSRLYVVSADGGIPTVLPMPYSGAGAFSPDGEQMVYSPQIRDFRTWKRHEGGWAQDLHIFELDGSASRNITNHVRTDRDPMWFGDSIYFVSDRDDFLNLYAYDPGTEATTQLTRHSNADARWASDDGQGRIVYELSGSLRIYDTRSGTDTAISVTVADDTTRSRPEVVNVSENIEGFSASPNANRVAIVARGEIFSVPVEHGVTRNLTATPGAHEREVSWSPDGQYVAYISDVSGEEELFIRDHHGREAPRQLTRGSSVRYYSPLWSPDSNYIAFGDAESRILVVDVEDGGVVLAGDDAGFATQDYAWSPDGQWLAYSAEDSNGLRSIHIWSADSERSRRVTGEMFSEYAPRFSPDGQHLFYLSDRMFSPQIDLNEWNYAVDRETGIFAMVLSEDGPNPFPPRNQEAVEDNGDSEGADDEDGEAEAVEVSIDFDGLAQRVVRVPVEPSNIGGLYVTDGHVLYVETGPFYYGRSSDSTPALMALSREDRESFKIADDIQGFGVSADGKQVIVRHAGSIKRYAVSEGDQQPDEVATAHLEAVRVPEEEWRAMFNEAWRRFRDHFYVQNMHGYDWQGLREQYQPLLDHVAHRSDLNYVLGEMVAELNVSHAYIAGGDLELPDRPSTALLGARLTADTGSGRFQISEIFAGSAEEEKYRSPLTEVGVNVDVGDYLLAINGQPLTTAINPYSLMVGAADGLVELEVADNARGRNSRTVLVNPLSSEDNLLYLAWVQANRERVDRETDGRVGYLHVPDMGSDGIYEFIKWYYGQIRKEGLIVDVRGNGGGNVSAMLINRLDRELTFVGYARGVDNIGTYPQAVFTGPMVALLNENSASDGDIFPAAFKERELGPLIGKRSWGGVIGITNLGPLLDGGSVFVPQFGFASSEGEWIIENIGVEPDIEVDNPPEALIRGEDPQLERGIAEIERMMRADPAALPPQPEPPVRTPRQR